ncbi:DegT/DnrJ/EryC1/StrS family aminotransferase [Rubrivivax sp. A210]|uniref:DegT/DnrJ/EryC1/StrS family aminotransferase n=1 Tax=Rubrivivax sp. A210 TaxID=2772301 RepID=UPI00191ABB26|nr:DegT/DnrJ/EryC1/StrS family aminotransferase [Rubrivivax sp. A210]
MAPDTLELSDPDISALELQLVQAALQSPQLSDGPLLARFEGGFARWLGRAHAVAVPGATLGTWLALRALGVGPGDEVIASAHGWQPVAQAVALAGARAVFGDIDYWSGCLDPARAAALITPATRALIVGNANGHPADWKAWRALADHHGLALIEDSSEALGSVYRGRKVGSFGDVAVFDFAQPSALCCGEGGMVATDNEALAIELRLLRAREAGDRRSVSAGARVPLQCGMSELTAALGLAQLTRIDEILERRSAVVAHYLDQMLSFEGIKPPYVAPDVDAVHWMLYVVHLGKRFGASACAQIIEDLATEGIAAAMYSRPLHQQHHYTQLGWKRGQLPLVERIADRALALPLHGHLEPGQIAFIVKTLKDSSLNVGAGAAIY